MKTRTILSLLFIVGLLTLSGAAHPATTRTPGSAAAGTVAPSSCDEGETKAKLYRKFLDNFKGNVEQQKVAYEAGKEYLSRYGSCPRENDKKIARYIGHWVAKYEEALREWERRKSQQP